MVTVFGASGRSLSKTYALPRINLLNQVLNQVTIEGEELQFKASKRSLSSLSKTRIESPTDIALVPF